MFNRLLVFISLLFLGTFFGCSSFLDSTRISMFGDADKKNSRQSKWIKKNKYDELMVKYKNLQDEYKKLNGNVDDSSDKFDQIDELAASTDPMATVDPFAKGVPMGSSISNGGEQLIVESNPEEVSKELDLFKKGLALRDNKKTDEALKIFQFLGTGKSQQIKVRAKLEIGNIYYSKGQYDLGLQVYESIIRNYAYSGKVLDALGKAVKCASKLGLEQKKLKYQSILKDFFGIEA